MPPPQLALHLLHSVQTPKSQSTFSGLQLSAGSQLLLCSSGPTQGKPPCIGCCCTARTLLVRPLHEHSPQSPHAFHLHGTGEAEKSQGDSPQGLICFCVPEQCCPSCRRRPTCVVALIDWSCFCRSRHCCPLPQVRVQVPKAVQSDQPQDSVSCSHDCVLQGSTSIELAALHALP